MNKNMLHTLANFGALPQVECTTEEYNQIPISEKPPRVTGVTQCYKFDLDDSNIALYIQAKTMRGITIIKNIVVTYVCLWVLGTIISCIYFFKYMSL